MAIRFPALQRQGFAAPPSGVLQGALNAESDLKSVTGIYDASRERNRRNEAARRFLRQKGRRRFHLPSIDNMTRAIRQAGRILVQYIPAIYDTPPSCPHPLAKTARKKCAKSISQSSEKDEQGNPVERIYDLGLGTYDVVCAAGPSYSTQRRKPLRVCTSNPAGRSATDAGCRGSVGEKPRLAGADELAERLKKTIPPELQDEEEQPSRHIPASNAADGTGYPRA